MRSVPACRIPRRLLWAASRSGSSEDAAGPVRHHGAQAATAPTSGGEGALSRARRRASSGGPGKASTACGATAQQRISAPTALTRTRSVAVGASSRVSASGAASSARRLSASLVSTVSAGQARSDSGEPRSRCIVFCSNGISSCDGAISSSAHTVYPTCLARGLGCCARPIAGIMANGVVRRTSRSRSRGRASPRVRWRCSVAALAAPALISHDALLVLTALALCDRLDQALEGDGGVVIGREGLLDRGRGGERRQGRPHSRRGSERDAPYWRVPQLTLWILH